MDAKKPKEFRAFDNLMRKLVTVPAAEMEIPMDRFNDQEITQAVETLVRSERGRCAMCDVVELMDNGATGLDEAGQVAVLSLVAACFGSKRGTTLDLMRQALAREDG